jgi:D-beta-D-heptose 7-phosphate kinase/D-beta-D-heptose 1-phosphate adenosyltransferase
MKKVFVNGTFDLIHPGHIALLQYAKSLGDTLLVALDSDDRIKLLKGLSRPINCLSTRLTIMSEFRSVDQTEHFNTDEELIHIIKNYKPDVMVVGSDYKDKKVVGSEYAKKLCFFDRIDNYSTTSIIREILNE